MPQTLADAPTGMVTVSAVNVAPGKTMVVALLEDTTLTMPLLAAVGKPLVVTSSLARNAVPPEATVMVVADTAEISTPADITVILGLADQVPCSAASIRSEWAWNE